jgi:hypothetical protein
VGFVRRTRIRANSMNLGYEFQSNDSWYVKVRPFVVMRYLKTNEGLTDESYVDPGVDLTLPRDVTLYIYHSFHRDGFEGSEYDYQFNVVDYTVNTWKTVRFEGRLQFGEGVNFDSRNALVGRNLELKAQMNWKRDERLDSEFLYLKSALSHPETRSRLFNQDIYRNRTNFQFTRFHALRSIVEYDGFSQRLALSFLYSVTPRPNTAVYLGYGDLLEDPLLPHSPPGLRRVNRTLFLKLSHGFRR